VLLLKRRLATFCFLVLSANAAFAQAPYHFGMNAHDVSGATADKVTELGADVIRVVFGWDQIEGSCKGCFNWTTTDAWRDEAHRTKRAIFATLAFTPRWANGGGPIQNPPTSYQDWYDFVFAVASRYKDDIFLWGVWNEPNLDQYFKDGDIGAYEQIVRAAQAAIHAANPSALVLGPEVSQHALLNGWYAEAMKRFGSFFDIVTVHWYPDAAPLETFMDQGVRPSSLKKNVWLTESGMTPCQSNFGEAGQALFYQRVLQAFEARRSWWTAVIFYDLYDPPTPMTCGSGIVGPTWANRPAFLLFQSFIRSHP
jgi:polysaccharide biosynthesis protein PslG